MKKLLKKTIRIRETGKESVKNPDKKEFGIQKHYLKSNSSCEVTFRLPKEAAPGAKTVTLVGDFNNWDKEATKMKKLKAGDFFVTIKLGKDTTYRFRYCIDGTRWENDWNADDYVPNSYGSDDSLVRV